MPTYAEIVRVVARLIADQRGEIIERAIAEGIPSREARLAEALVPVAYAHAIIEEQGWAKVLPDEYMAKNRHGEWLSFRLTGHPIYRAAAELAEHQRVAHRREFGAIAGTSAEVGAVSKWLDQSPPGTPIRDIVFSPACLIGVAAEEITEQQPIAGVTR